MLVIVNDCNENHSERLKNSNERKSVKILFQFNKLSGCDAIYEDKALCSARYYLFLIICINCINCISFLSQNQGNCYKWHKCLCCLYQKHQIWFQ